MNKVILMGRLVRDPETKWTQGEKPMAITRYTLAVDRNAKRNDGQTADFINCVAFGRQAEFAEKWLKKGTKIAITGHIQTGSYTNKDGLKVYTTDVAVESSEFCESKSATESNTIANPNDTVPVTTDAPKPVTTQMPEWMQIADGADEELPFS